MSNDHFEWQAARAAADQFGASKVGDRPVVVALHCSGADGSQWRKLAAALEPDFATLTPDMIGCGAVTGWHGRHAFTLADEAERILAVIEACQRPVHLVGHSYGGGVALRIAAARPSCLASLTLYEPSAFHLLKERGSGGAAELAEIEGLGRAVARGLISGAYADAAAAFVDYWNGAGAWGRLRPELRSALQCWLPNAALHFHALLSETTSLGDMGFEFPVLLMRGDYALAPSRLIVEQLADVLSQPVARIRSAGHMGPITHADAVIAHIKAHLVATEVSNRTDRPRRLDAA